MESRNTQTPRQDGAGSPLVTNWRARRRRIAQLEALLATLRHAQVADPAWLPGVVDELLERAAFYTEADRSRAAWAEHVQLERRIRRLLAQRGPDVVVDVAAELADALPSTYQRELLENYCAANRRIP
jgi:hypothetical protein